MILLIFQFLGTLALSIARTGHLVEKGHCKNYTSENGCLESIKIQLSEHPGTGFAAR
jgi:hypothetical protein